MSNSPALYWLFRMGLANILCGDTQFQTLHGYVSKGRYSRHQQGEFANRVLSIFP